MAWGGAKLTCSPASCAGTSLRPVPARFHSRRCRRIAPRMCRPYCGLGLPPSMVKLRALAPPGAVPQSLSVNGALTNIAVGLYRYSNLVGASMPSDCWPQVSVTLPPSLGTLATRFIAASTGRLFVIAGVAMFAYFLSQISLSSTFRIVTTKSMRFPLSASVSVNVSPVSKPSALSPTGMCSMRSIRVEAEVVGLSAQVGRPKRTHTTDSWAC